MKISISRNACAYGKVLFVCLSVLLLFAPMKSDASQSAAVDTLGRWQVKTNLLWDATLTPNLGLELRTDKRQSLQVFYGFNKWNLSGDKRLQNWAVMPEYRWWTKQAFRGWFMGVHAFGGEYNIGGIKFPFNIWKSEQNHRYDGYMLGAGFTIGHAWKLAKRWSLEAALGLGYTYTEYDKYKCEACGEQLTNKSKHLVGPTKLALNLAYRFGKKSHEPIAPEVQIIERVDTVVVEKVTHTDRIDTVVVEKITNNERVDVVVKETKVMDKIFTLKGKADIKFVVNKTVIDDRYMGNQQQLKALADTLRILASNPNILTMKVRIKGTASPEGSYQHNLMLSQGRAQAVVDRLKQIAQLPDNCELTSYFVPENWEGLAEFIKNDKTFTEVQRKNLLEIATRTVGDPDQREAELKTKYPREYRYLLTYCYPALRQTEYEVEIIYKR